MSVRFDVLEEGEVGDDPSIPAASTAASSSTSSPSATSVPVFAVPAAGAASPTRFDDVPFEVDVDHLLHEEVQLALALPLPISITAVPCAQPCSAPLLVILHRARCFLHHIAHHHTDALHRTAQHLPEAVAAPNDGLLPSPSLHDVEDRGVSALLAVLRAEAVEDQLGGEGQQSEVVDLIGEGGEVEEGGVDGRC